MPSIKFEPLASLKNGFNTISTSFATNSKKVSDKIKNVKVSLPKVSIPKVSLPKVSLPKVSLPTVKKPSLPKLSLPKLSLPRLSLRKRSAPKRKVRKHRVVTRRYTKGVRIIEPLVSQRKRFTAYVKSTWYDYRHQYVRLPSHDSLDELSPLLSEYEREEEVDILEIPKVSKSKVQKVSTWFTSLFKSKHIQPVVDSQDTIIVSDLAVNAC